MTSARRVVDTRLHGLRCPAASAGQAHITRRRFGLLAGSLFASCAVGACGPGEARGADDGRITARPGGQVKAPGEGNQRSAEPQMTTRALGLDRSRDALLQIPGKPGSGLLPLILLLHGATGSAAGILRRIGSAGDAAGVAVLAPDSRDDTWDAIRGGFDRDVTFINRALERVFESVPVDPARIAVGGFSDGATYALSLGLINGDLFRRVVAFSPGFVVQRVPRGRPAFFVSHGMADPILSIDRCSRVIVPALRQRRYDVTFREFDGGHEVPAAIAGEAMAWVAKT